MTALPDLADRGRLLVERGALYGRLERALDPSVEGLSASQQDFLRRFHDHMPGATIGTLLELTGLQLAA